MRFTRTKVGLTMMLFALVPIFTIFMIYTFSHGVFLYYLFIYGEKEVIFSPYIALGSFAAFILFLHLAWPLVIVGFILVLTEALRYGNFARNLVALILWILFLPGFYGIIYLFFQIGLNPLERGVYMIVLVAVFIWVVFPLFIPLKNMHGKRRIKWPLILLPFCAVASIVISFFRSNEETMVAMLPIALFFNLAMLNLIWGYLGVYHWVKCIPKGASRKEMLAHKFIYWHEKDTEVPDQIICQSDTDFITLTVKPVAQESLLGRRSLRISAAALVFTVLFSVNCIVLKREGALFDMFRSFSIPILGTISIALILIALAYSGYTVRNIKEGRFKEDKKAQYAMTLAVGTAVLFLALSMSIAIYLS